MNILIITQLYPQPDDLGDNRPTKTVEYFAKEWINMGHNVVVAHCPSRFPILYYLIPSTIKNKIAGTTSNIIPSLSSRKKLKREDSGITIYRFPMLKFFPGEGYSPKKMAAQAKEINYCLESDNFTPDLVIGHFANPSTELTAILANKYGAKSSIVFHNDCSESNIIKYRIDESISKIGAVGARSELEASLIQERLLLTKKPFVCYSGVPNDAVLTADKTCDKHDYSKGVRYLYTGSFIKRKHLDTVIKAFASVSRENDTLTIIGGGPEEDDIKALVINLKVEDKVFFTGRISREEVLAHMKEAHVFTLISHGETYGMVYIEAMLQGCLTIASNGGGFDGLIHDGVNGFLCEPGNQNNLEDIYSKIINLTSIERNEIGQSAIDTALNFSERKVAEKYLDDILLNQR